MGKLEWSLNSSKASGGALFDLVSHDIDFARYCLGEPDSITPDPVLCREMNGNLIAAVLHYPGNNVFVEGGFVTPSHFPFRRNYTAYFENGTLISDAPGDFREIARPAGRCVSKTIHTVILIIRKWIVSFRQS